MRLHLASVFAAILISAVACSGGGSSPTEPPAPESTSTIVIADAAGEFADHHDSIVGLLEGALAEARTALVVDPVTITVLADPRRAIPGWGMGGYAISRNQIEIVLDPAFPGLGAVLAGRLPPIAAHELHHAVRFRGPGYGFTLLGAMISEGLADHFAVELLGAPLPPWSQAFPAHENDLFLGLACAELSSTTYNFGAWFLAGNSELPPWTGYTLGYRLVAEYQEENPGLSAADLVHAAAGDFRPDCSS